MAGYMLQYMVFIKTYQYMYMITAVVECFHPDFLEPGLMLLRKMKLLVIFGRPWFPFKWKWPSGPVAFHQSDLSHILQFLFIAQFFSSLKMSNLWWMMMCNTCCYMVYYWKTNNSLEHINREPLNLRLPNIGMLQNETKTDPPCTFLSIF